MGRRETKRPSSLYPLSFPLPFPLCLLPSALPKGRAHAKQPAAAPRDAVSDSGPMQYEKAECAETSRQEAGLTREAVLRRR